MLETSFVFPMTVCGVEYQFDRMKLTVYYTSDVRIDFREMVKALFAVLKTRVWMKKTNQSRPFVPRRFATMQLATGLQFPPY